MNTDTSGAREKGIRTAIGIGKDLIVLVRDAGLVLLVAFLVLFPAQLNEMLRAAGFKEATIVGLKWEDTVVKSTNALEQAQKRIAELQKINTEQADALAEARAQLADSALKQRIAKLEDDSATQQASTVLVQSAVAQTIENNVALVEKTRPSRDKSDYLVGLQTVGVPDKERIAINKKLQAEGYGLDSITWSYAADDRPTWFAARSTVFYYSSSALGAAQDVARFMKAVTRQDFAVQRGAGLGVDPSRKNVTLFVHYLKR